MFVRLGVLGLSILMVQACTNAPPHNPHAVQVRMMGNAPQTQSASTQNTQPVRQAAIYNPGRVSTADPVRPSVAHHIGEKQTVSVSPYEGRFVSPATTSAQRPIQQQQNVVTTRPTQTYNSAPQTPAVVPSATKTQTSVAVAPSRPAPVVPAQASNMSISDVIDTTIRNAPDLPVASTGATAPAKSETASGAGQSVATVPQAPAKGTGHQPSKQELASLGGDKPRFYWPVRGNVVSTYGSKGSGKQNDGINISAPKGTPVKASAAGLVVYSGEDLGGLGHLILIRHSGNYHTAYAHVDNKLVKTGDRVAVGQAIANVGKTGNVTTPQLHFEIRDGKKPVNPDSFLPRS
jgi:murein DD-endopeptidase MepM/ murein hydrolase activator NlpD